MNNGNLNYTEKCNWWQSPHIERDESNDTPIYIDLSQTPTLRDQFAMAALTGLLADGNPSTDSNAKFAYQIADAMMEARK
jgi:hypothetical protein